MHAKQQAVKTSATALKHAPTKRRAGSTRTRKHAVTCPKPRKLIVQQLFVICSAILILAAAIWVDYVKNHPTAPDLHKTALTEEAGNAQKEPIPQILTPAIISSPSEPRVDDYTIPPAEDGLAPVLSTVPTTQPVVFLGIDDGAFRDPSVVSLMRDNHVHASLFLADSFLQGDYAFFRQLTELGSVVEPHTIHHDTTMASKSYDYQKAEICGMADIVTEQYGRRPTLFRPPGGGYSNTMRRAAHDCGMKAIVTWIAKANGGGMQYQYGQALRPGDIVLMHFRPEFKDDMQAFLDAVNAAGLRIELLESIPGAM